MSRPDEQNYSMKKPHSMTPPHLSLRASFVSLPVIAALISALIAFGGLAQGQVALLQVDFEGSSSLPSGWGDSQLSGAATWNIQTGGASSQPATAHGGTNNACLYINSTNDNETRLISPVFDSSDFSGMSLSFWHTQPLWSQDQDELKVLYSTDGGTTWTQLAHYTSSVTSWTERSLALPSVSSTSCIAFEGNAKYGFGICLDDIEVSGTPETISAVTVSATDNSASEVDSEPGTWTITRTGITTTARSVNFALSGTATQGSDYNLDTTSPVSFAAGETSKVVTLTPIDDAVGSEESEVATLTLTSGSGYLVTTASDDISIYDDEGFELNILVVGSTSSFSDGGESGVVAEKAFNPTNITTHLQDILSQDAALGKTVNVQHQEVFKMKTNFVHTSKTGSANITEHCYSLGQHYFWPDGKADRLAHFRGENGTKWDYVILCGDPYIMANFPGMYAEGVKLIKDEAARSTNPIAPQVVLLAQWPENSSSFSADDFNEVVHRVGNSADLIVVPGGKVWDSYTSQDTSTSAHPTPRGAYLAAASIYSSISPTLFETTTRRSASTSVYDFTADGDNIANHALSVIDANAGVAQYSGDYDTPNVFTMKYVPKRVVSFRETGTSTEDGLRDALNRLDDVQRITFNTTGYSDAGGTRWDFNYGRGNDGWEDSKDYEVNPDIYDRSYGFPMHYYNTSTAPLTMPYGIDKHYHGSGYEDGSDLGIAYNMVRPSTRETGLPEGHDVRAIPIRLIWCKMEQASPGFNPLGDNTHMHKKLNDASAAFMYTLLSGRCAIVDEPASPGSDAWLQWLGHKIGYETAWQMSHLTTRSPGFQVMPAAFHAKTLTSTSTETMTVRFMNPPQQNVTVNISSSNPAYATVSPSVLTFTPSNYNIPQEVTMTAVAADQGLQDINVVYSTSSTDEIYENLADSWAYTSNTQIPTYEQSVLLTGFDGTNVANTTSSNAGVYKEISMPKKSATSFTNVNARLSTTSATVGSFQRSAMSSPSAWGGEAFLPPASTGNDMILMADNEATISYFIENTGLGNVTLEKLHFRLQRDNATGGSADQITIALASGDLTSSGPGVQPLVSANGGNSYDFDLSSILTDATLSPGESATLTFHVVPSDTVGTNRRVRIDNLAISGAITNDYYTWSQIHSVSLAGIDDDLDGLTNEFERLFGLNPNSNNSHDPIAVPLNPATGQFSYTRRTQSLTSNTYKVWYSTNLSDWFEDTNANQAAGTPSNGVETVAVTLDTSLLLYSNLFIRMSTEP